MKVILPVGALHIGGGCRVLADVANALSKAGHDVTVVIPKGMPLEYKLRCKVKWVPALKKEYIPKGDIVVPNFYTTFQSAYEAWPDKCVRLSLGFEPYWVPDKDYAISTYAHGVPIIAISHWLDDQIYNHVGARCTVVNLGVNRKVFRPNGQKKHNDVKVILYMARDPNSGYQLKGYSDFVAAMNILKKTCRRKFVVNMICPERILPLDGIPHKVYQPKTDQEIARLYRKADVFVSTSWFEGFALPPLEAISCGTPVVTTNSGGILDFCVHKKSAYITEPMNPNQLARGIKRLLYSQSLKRTLIREGIKSARKHTQQKFEREIVEALERIHASRH